ncbi:kinase-like protein [Rickenella mellea]|uniref:Kinase-like protein n=1 Tax=Rickenella mellea TaxID=50990 RepID=A0A4Y7Q9N8_9AGAM|nr:kinase-like protein [Rickenella mellea]
MMKFLDDKSEDELVQKVSSAKIYQRTIAYVYVQLKTSPMRHSSLSALDSLGRALASWDAWDAGQWLVKHHTVRSTLWEILNKGTSSHAHNSRYFDLQNLLKSDLLTIQSLIITVLSNRDKKKAFFGMCSADPVPVLNLLQTILDRGDLSKDDQPRFARTLARLVKSSSCLPDCLMLSGVQRTGKDPVAGGGFADVWTGYFGSTPVAIKALRIYDHSNQEKALRDFAHEAIIWRLLRHPNILKFYGVFRGDDRLCLVSPWMSAGNIVKYLENNPKSDRLALLGDVVNGLAYLHDFQPAIIHGDLKGANIFVTSTRTACLGDFGLSSFRDSQESTLGATTGNTTGTLRWQAPELFDSLDDGGTTRPSQESDIYSFGCVCLELMTGKPPFMEIRRDGAVMKAIMNGQTPRRPVGDLVKYGLDDKLWAVMEKCWSHDPTQRPEIEALLAYFDKSRESAIEDNSIEHISHEIRASLDQYGFPENRIRFLP